VFRLSSPPAQFFFFMARQPLVVQASWMLRFRDHSHTPHRILPKGGLARHRDLYLTTHNTHKRHTSLPTEESEPAIPASDRSQTHGQGKRSSATNYYTNENLAVEQLHFLFRIQDDAGWKVNLKTYYCLVFVSFHADSSYKTQDDSLQ
jgi:hypothetical protein